MMLIVRDRIEAPALDVKVLWKRDATIDVERMIIFAVEAVRCF